MDSFKQKRNVSDMPKNFPQTIPVFPLYGCILLPKTILPLNIFEPRYRQMVEHAMESEEMIGMILDDKDPSSVESAATAVSSTT